MTDFRKKSKRKPAIQEKVATEDETDEDDNIYGRLKIATNDKKSDSPKPPSAAVLDFYEILKESK